MAVGMSSLFETLSMEIDWELISLLTVDKCKQHLAVSQFSHPKLCVSSDLSVYRLQSHFGILLSILACVNNMGSHRCIVPVFALAPNRIGMATAAITAQGLGLKI